MKKILLACLLLLVLCAGAAVLRWKPSQWEDVLVMPFRQDEKSASVALKEGQTLAAFARELRSLGIVADSRNLLYWLRKKNADRTLRAGNYTVSSGASWYVAEQLKNAVPVYFSAVILPGALPMKPLPFGSESEQLAALADDANYPEALRPLLPDAPEARAAFLLPETYSLTEETLPALVRQASAAWHKRFGARVADRAAAFRSSVIASLLQREAMKNEEYATIAGVIENRLAKNMLLQIDASVVYAWYLAHGEILKRVLYKHLEIDSPYNTYKHAGLPPAPICVPSAAAWEGALAPQKHPYYYYVASGDGGHIFAKTQKEHENNVRRVRKKK